MSPPANQHKHHPATRPDGRQLSKREKILPRLENQKSNKWEDFTHRQPKSIAVLLFWAAQRFTAAIKEQFFEVSS
ncbi:MAG: hypothetical protein ABSG02_09690 [Terriglobales bacterium]